MPDLLDRVKAYYEGRVARYGATPPGVDWTCRATQYLRFVQLLGICSFENPFSLNDLGCGYGALLDFLSERYPSAEVDYCGIDISRSMVRRGRRLHENNTHCRFVVGAVSPRAADYSVASGIFNVMLDHARGDWEAFIEQTLDDLHRTSGHGFAVNFLGEGAQRLKMRGLYRTSPERWIRYCERHLKRSVEISNDYGMHEFTLLVRAKS